MTPLEHLSRWVSYVLQNNLSLLSLCTIVTISLTYDLILNSEVPDATLGTNDKND